MSKVAARTDSTPASPDEQSSRAAEASSDEQDDSFSPLMQRLESAIHRLKLAADGLSDLAEPMPTVEHGSAAYVVAETTEYLNRLYRDLDAWEGAHDYTPKEDIDRMLHGRAVLSPLESPAPSAP